MRKKYWHFEICSATAWNPMTVRVTVINVTYATGNVSIRRSKLGCIRVSRVKEREWRSWIYWEMNEHQQNHGKSGKPPSFSLLGRAMSGLTVNPRQWGLNTCKNKRGKKGGFSDLMKVWRYWLTRPFPKIYCQCHRGSIWRLYLNDINYCKGSVIYISPALAVSMRFKKYLGWLPVTPVEKICSNRPGEVRCYSLNYDLVVNSPLDGRIYERAAMRGSYVGSCSTVRARQGTGMESTPTSILNTTCPSPNAAALQRTAHSDSYEASTTFPAVKRAPKEIWV